jgi:hypothetical protein
MILLLFQILLDAATDAFKNKGNQKLSHLFKSLEKVVWFTLAWHLVNIQFHQFPELILLYLALRVALFDLIINLVMGWKWDYIGLPSTSWYGKLVNWFVDLYGVGSFIYLKIIALFLAVCEIINLW